MQTGSKVSERVYIGTRKLSSCLSLSYKFFSFIFSPLRPMKWARNFQDSPIGPMGERLRSSVLPFDWFSSSAWSRPLLNLAKMKKKRAKETFFFSHTTLRWWWWWWWGSSVETKERNLLLFRLWMFKSTCEMFEQIDHKCDII